MINNITSTLIQLFEHYYFLKLGGGTTIAVDLRESIKLYIRNNSRSAANRMLDHETPIRYLNDTKIELYKNFPYKHLVSGSTFFKYLNADKIYKKASNNNNTRIIKIINPFIKNQGSEKN